MGVIFSTLFSVNFASAATENTTPVFTVYPSYTHQGNKSWLIYDVNPGDTVKDYLTLENFSKFPVKLKVYYEEGEGKLGSFITLPETFVDLAPEEKKRIDFLYTLPKNFSEGNYTGVFYAEPVSESTSAISVKTRIGVRTFINVSSVLPIGAEFSVNTYQKIFFVISAMLLLLTFAWGSKKALILPVLLFSINFLPLTNAQNMEIEVEGAGYRILGPDNIVLPEATASFSSQQTTVAFEDLVGTGQDLEIIDENGGVPFAVNVSSTPLISSGSAISNTNIEIKNYDGDGDEITLVEGASEQVDLSSDTDSFASLDVSRTLFVADSFVLPGQWRIYPAIRVTIPAGTTPGLYRSTLTFTIN